jgi:hypothetical protein
MSRNNSNYHQRQGVPCAERPCIILITRDFSVVVYDFDRQQESARA